MRQYDFTDGWTVENPNGIMTVTATQVKVYGGQAEYSINTAWKDFGLVGGTAYYDQIGVEIHGGIQRIGGGNGDVSWLKLSKSGEGNNSYQTSSAFIMLKSYIPGNLYCQPYIKGTTGQYDSNYPSVNLSANTTYYFKLIVEKSGGDTRHTLYLYSDSGETNLLGSYTSNWITQVSGLREFQAAAGGDGIYGGSYGFIDTVTDMFSDAPPPSLNRLWARPDGFGWIA